MKIEGESVKLLAAWDKQREVYQNVISLLAAEGTLDSYQLKLLEAYPLLNTRGVMKNPETMQSVQKILHELNTGRFIDDVTDVHK